MEEMVQEQAAAVAAANHSAPWLQPHAGSWCDTRLQHTVQRTLVSVAEQPTW